MSRKIPATIVTGFLGAGKTSALRALIAQNGTDGRPARRIAFIINEFGDLGVDRGIVEGCGLQGCEPEDVVELANGCICCTVADDFLPTMERLLDRADPPDHIVIETSGLALPKPLIQAFNWPSVKARVTVDGVVTLIDGPAVAAGTFAGDLDAVAAQRAADPSLDHDDPLAEVFDDQLSAADLVVLNKRDLLEPQALADVEARIAARLRPGVKTITTTHGALPADVFLGMAAAAEDDLAVRPSCHDGEAEHDHDDFESFVFRFGATSDLAALTERLRAMAAATGVLRVKGFVAVENSAMRCVVQGVGERIDRYFDRPWAPDETASSALVVIGLKGLDRARIERMMAA
jgi:cobalamin biosynthesis protein CobW